MLPELACLHPRMNKESRYRILNLRVFRAFLIAVAPSGAFVKTTVELLRRLLTPTRGKLRRCERVTPQRELFAEEESRPHNHRGRALRFPMTAVRLTGGATACTLL